MKDYFGKPADALKNKKLFLFDMDGTVYLDETLFDGAKELFSAIDQKKGKYVFITNNSSRSVGDYVLKMHRLGLKNITEEHFYTSGQAAQAFLSENYPGKRVYVQATASLIKEYRALGMDVTDEYDESASAILVGFDTEVTGEKIYGTCKMLTNLKVPYFATNPDLVCQVDFGFIPDCGTYCDALERATGRKPIYIGKPAPTMIFTAMKKFGYSAEETVVVGDRLYTDVASGNNALVDTVCVLSGEATAEEILNASGEKVPTFVLKSIADLIDLIR